MTGKWYLVGFATNAQWFVTHKDHMKMGVAMLTPTADGDLDISHASLKADGTCWRMSHLALKTDTPGRFTFYSETWQNDNDLRVVDVLYDDFALLHTIKTKNGVSEIVSQLLSRTPEVRVTLQEKFTQYCTENGILPENIAFLPKNAECPEV
ncbi:unnamed protein product [Lampetra planeri]